MQVDFLQCLLMPHPPRPLGAFAKSFKILFWGQQDLQGVNLGNLVASDALGVHTSQAPRGDLSEFCSLWSWESSGLFVREGVTPLPPTSRTLQAAGFITPVWTVLFLIAALDCRDTSPFPTLKLVPTTGPQGCQEKAKQEGQGQCGIGTALLPQTPAPAHICARQEQN